MLDQVAADEAAGAGDEDAATGPEIRVVFGSQLAVELKEATSRGYLMELARPEAL